MITKQSHRVMQIKRKFFLPYSLGTFIFLLSFYQFYKPLSFIVVEDSTNENHRWNYSSSGFPPPPAPTDAISQEKDAPRQEHTVAGLSCKAFKGGPDDDFAQEMVYWRDIPSDAMRVSPFYDPSEERFLTFKPDYGGFNNVRMVMEVAVTLAVAMGRTLVLPPPEEMFLLNVADDGTSREERSLEDFYHFTSISYEHQAAGRGFKVISFQEYLEREAMTGHLRDSATGNITFPPGNRTDWSGLLSNMKTNAGYSTGVELWNWLTRATTPLNFQDAVCLAAFPKEPNDTLAPIRMRAYLEDVLQKDKERFETVNIAARWRSRASTFTGHPVPVNASTTERLAEVLADRVSLCVYSQKWQQAKTVHLTGNKLTGHRLLMPFYALLFFEDWHQDLWIKRFVRDHLRYKDQIQCAAARVVAAVRHDAKHHGDPNGTFDSMHVRRGDFQAQYPMVEISAEEIYTNNTRFMLTEGRTVFIATDERNASFFGPLRQHYNIKFLSDYLHLISDVNRNYYGMIDQLVAARGDVFVGSVLSTFSAYINRMRGYHVQKSRSPGYEGGTLQSYYYAPDTFSLFRKVMHTYKSVEQPFWAQDFPLGWRDIDFDVEDNQILSR